MCVCVQQGEEVESGGGEAGKEEFSELRRSESEMNL